MTSIPMTWPVGFSLMRMSSYCLIFLLSFIVLLYEANASSGMGHCTTGYRTPSLYRQYCCLSANNGKAFKMNESNSYAYIFCPTAGLPKALCYSLGLINFYSCSEVLENIPNAASGYYNISQSNGSIVSVYCDMEGSYCDGNGGWTRIGYINMTEPGATCPQGLYNYTYGGKTLCDKSQGLGNGCNSTFFSAIGLNYTKVCGQARGYQFGSPDGVYPNGYDIDDAYVDGLSITHGSNPRQHIWTYAVGVTADDASASSCPCNNGTTATIPSYVGNDYYCESGTTFRIYNFVPDDIIWDGQQCDLRESPCCSSSTIPWFIKTLPQSVTDDIELRVCSNEGYSNEATPIDIIEIYIC
uniref:Fibrinogen C-terminal domain-containing protein n=1 Tax=Amphimedon queenslandica TaxID=400682 RepID=A0A1X7TDV2_AMPQE